MRKVWVMRCPSCGATDVWCDESRSFIDINCLCCRACNNVEYQDSWERDFNWYLEIELAEGAPVPDKVEPLNPEHRFP